MLNCAKKVFHLQLNSCKISAKNHYQTLGNTLYLLFLSLQEYPYQLVCLDDKYRIGQCLCDWRVFDHLYNEEYSSQMLFYWRMVSESMHRRLKLY